MKWTFTVQKYFSVACQPLSVWILESFGFLIFGFKILHLFPGFCPLTVPRWLPPLGYCERLLSTWWERTHWRPVLPVPWDTHPVGFRSLTVSLFLISEGLWLWSFPLRGCYLSEINTRRMLMTRWNGVLAGDTVQRTAGLGKLFLASWAMTDSFVSLPSCHIDLADPLPTLPMSGPHSYVSSVEWRHGGWPLAIRRLEVFLGGFLGFCQQLQFACTLQAVRLRAVREKWIQLQALVWLWRRQAVC